MNKLVVEEWEIGRLRPYERNPRVNDPAVPKMIAAIEAFGFRIPVVARSDGLIVDGHLRYKAAVKMGMQTVPVALADGLSDEQIRAFRLLANKSVSWADWDDGLLAEEMGLLHEADFDLSLTGFDDDEIKRLLGTDPNGEGLTDPDDVPEPPAHPVSQPGDVWVLGRHRIICGSSTDANTVAKVLNGVKPHLMVTDPPYGVNYDPTWRHATGLNNSARIGKVQNDDKADWRDAWALFPGDVAYIWHGALHATTVAESLAACNFQIRSQIIWAKPRFVIGRGDYHWQHEPCWYAVRKGKTGHYGGDRKQTTLWQIEQKAGAEDDATVHGTQKPVECMKRPIENNSSPGQAVYEPFSGSGTTIIAAEMTGRSCHAVELSEQYVDVAVKRWQAFTGQDAVLEETGQTFSEVMEARPVRESAAS